MAESIVTTVIAGLTAAGIRAGAAWPGQSMPHLTSPAAAVSLFQVNQQDWVTEVLVTVLCPGELGGQACEEEGLRVVEALSALGASCVQEGCKYDSRTGLFSAPVYAAFTGNTQESSWTSGVDMAVCLSGAPLPYLTGFTAEQVTADPAVVSVYKCGWKFKIEEFFAPGEPEQNDPEEPFTITVDRTGRSEIFHNCYLTGIKREDTPTGLKQTREGTAESMEFMSIA